MVGLVNPDRDPGPSHVHGLTDPDLVGAPRFAQLTNTINALTAGRVLVAHNAPYDVAFLNAEYERADTSAPLWPSLCTMRLSAILGTTAARRLGSTCAALGIPIEREHSALGDAMATAQLLNRYLELARAAGMDTLESLGCEGSILTGHTAWSGDHHAGVQRRGGPVSSPLPSASLARLTARARLDGQFDQASNAYLDVLDRALSDHVITEVEAAELARIASSWGMDLGQVSRLNRAYMAALASAGPTADELALHERAAARLGIAVEFG
jgi:ATP-dependent helicase Lhr and Lhr-like helicase